MNLHCSYTILLPACWTTMSLGEATYVCREGLETRLPKYLTTCHICGQCWIHGWQAWLAWRWTREANLNFLVWCESSHMHFRIRLLILISWCTLQQTSQSLEPSHCQEMSNNSQQEDYGNSRRYLVWCNILLMYLLGIQNLLNLNFLGQEISPVLLQTASGNVF